MLILTAYGGSNAL